MRLLEMLCNLIITEVSKKYATAAIYWVEALEHLASTFLSNVCINLQVYKTTKKTKKLHGLSPRANYTDRATAACRRSDCQLLRIEVQRGQRDGSLRPYIRFSRQEPLLFYQVAPQLYSRGWVDPVPDPLLFFYKRTAIFNFGLAPES
jgi:hypothetical protein